MIRDDQIKLFEKLSIIDSVSKCRVWSLEKISEYGLNNLLGLCESLRSSFSPQVGSKN